LINDGTGIINEFAQAGMAWDPLGSGGKAEEGGGDVAG
jgi:hypothetical protein